MAENGRKDPAEVATRRVLRCLQGIEDDCHSIRRRLAVNGAQPEAADARGIARQANELTEYLAVLETLRGE